ncbi:unnamed protein product [Rotaria sp. Silwood2]|nr:unnamed protein product [Rotaria sp. Silwood2]CAF4751925.1 unnamed protein product [Rotaria sp. Silwood2]
MGCSQSKSKLLLIKAMGPESRPRSIKLHLSPNHQSDRIVEDYFIIWFLNDSSIEVKNQEAKLRHVVSTVKIFLTVLTMESFLDSMRNLPRVEKIYVLDSSFHDAEKTMDLAVSSNIFYNIDNLCKQ